MDKWRRRRRVPWSVEVRWCPGRRRPSFFRWSWRRGRSLRRERPSCRRGPCRRGGRRIWHRELRWRWDWRWRRRGRREEHWCGTPCSCTSPFASWRSSPASGTRSSPVDPTWGPATVARSFPESAGSGVRWQSPPLLEMEVAVTWWRREGVWVVMVLLWCSSEVNILLLLFINYYCVIREISLFFSSLI